MNDRYLDRDLELISAYIDSRLSPAENTEVKERLIYDPLFKQLLNDLTYTRGLLQALPKKSAPRNFTISAERAPVQRRAFWLQPALSFVSVAAAVTLVIVFASSFLLGGASKAAPGAPASQSTELRAMEDSESAAPAIINWNPVYGMGGGGEDTYAGGVGGGGAGGPGWDVSAPEVASEPAATETPADEIPPEMALIPETPVEEEPPLTAMAEPESEPMVKTAAEDDLSTLILGLPDEESQGDVIASASDQLRETQQTGDAFPVNTIMIVSGIIAVLSGIAALILRRS